MKLLCCDECHNVLLPFRSWVWCECKSIGGVYYNNSWMVYARKTKDHQRVIGVDNAVRYGIKRRGQTWIQEPLTASGKNLNEIEHELVINKTEEELSEIVEGVRVSLGEELEKLQGG